jgi:hypothetical protein
MRRLALAFSLFAFPAFAGEDHSQHAAGPPVEAPPAGAKVSFAGPAAGAQLASPVKVMMKVEGMTVAPAGALQPGTGHHHVIVDGDAMPAGTVIPADATHLHFGGGQTEASLDLAPGKHTLTLQFADGLHRSYGPAMSAKIEIEVLPPAPK